VGYWLWIFALLRKNPFNDALLADRALLALFLCTCGFIPAFLTWAIAGRWTADRSRPVLWIGGYLSTVVITKFAIDLAYRAHFFDDHVWRAYFGEISGIFVLLITDVGALVVFIVFALMRRRDREARAGKIGKRANTG
jgi:hypothetical protein